MKCLLSQCAGKKSEPFKIYVALLAAGVTPATIYTLKDIFFYDSIGPFIFWIYAFLVAFAHAALLGMPVYFLCKKYDLLGWWASLIGGFIVGILPLFLMILLPSILDLHNNFISWNEFKSLGCAGLLGMSGGFAAWLTWSHLNKTLPDSGDKNVSDPLHQ